MITGIVLIIAGVFSLLFSALNMLGYKNMLDGSAEHYRQLHRRMITFLIIGAVLALTGTACLIIRCKI